MSINKLIMRSRELCEIVITVYYEKKGLEDDCSIW